MKARWILGLAAGAGVVFALAAFFVARSTAFREFLLAQIVQQVEKATGNEVAIRELAIRWHPFTTDFYGVVLRGSEADSQAPLLSVDHVRVRVGILALVRKQVQLYEVTVDRPSLYVRVDSKGNSNLPPMRMSAASKTSAAVSIRHFAIHDGVVRYNDEDIPLSADLHGFRTEAAVGNAEATVMGTLSYEQGWLEARGVSRFEHSAEVSFEASREQIVLNRLVVSSGGSRITANAKISNLGTPLIEGDYDGVVVLREVARILEAPSLPYGEVRVAGRVRYQRHTDEPFLQAVHVEGRALSDSIVVRAPQLVAIFRAVRGDYRVANGNVEIIKADANVMDGRVTASGRIAVTGKGAGELLTQIRDASLETLDSAMATKDRLNPSLLGRMNADARISWAKSIQRLVMRSHLDVTAPEHVSGDSGIPVSGVADLTYDRAGDTISFLPSHFRTGHTDISLSGTLSRQANLNVTVSSEDLHELSVLVSNIAANGPAPDGKRGYDISGAGRFAGQITGTTSAPRIHGQLFGKSLQVQGMSWQAVQANIDASPSHVSIQNGLLRKDAQAQINLSGQTDLQNWSPTPASAISLRANVVKFPVRDLERLAGREYRVTGQLSGDVTLGGSMGHPTGHGSVKLVNGIAWNQAINFLALDLNGDKEAVHAQGRIVVPAGTVNGEVSYSPATERYDAELTAAGVKLDQIAILQGRVGSVKGLLTVQAKGAGTLKDPQLTATLKVPELQVSGQTFSKVESNINVAQQRLRVVLDSTVARADIHAKGDVDLQGDYVANATLQADGVPIGAMLASFLPSAGSDVNGEMDARASFSGPLKDPSRIRANAEVPTLKIAYNSLQLASEGPIQLSYRDSVVHIDQARLKGSGTDFAVQGTVPLRGTAPMNLSASGVIDVALLKLVSPDASSSGQVNLNLQARGNLSAPNVQGKIQVVNAAYTTDELPVGLTAVNGEMDVSGNKIEVRDLQGKAGGGTISAHGSLLYGKQSSFALDLQAQSVRIHPNGVHSTLDGKLQLNGTPENSSLTGQVLVDHLSFQQGSDLSSIVGQFSGESVPSTPSPFESHMKLNVSVQSTDNLNVASSQLSIAGSMNLTVTNTLADPVILGRIALTSGEVFFLGKRFEVQSGTIVFANPVRTEPVVNLFVSTTIEQYNITINFLGPLDRLKTNYTSDPSLPPLDIINLLAFGQTTAEQTANAAAPTSLGAEGVVAQGVASQLASRVQSLAGISQLTIDPLAGTTQNPGAQLAIQQRVSGNLLLTFSTNITTTQNQAVQLEYRPKRQITISVLRDEYGGYGIDVKLHKVF